MKSSEPNHASINGHQVVGWVVVIFDPCLLFFFVKLSVWVKGKTPAWKGIPRDGDWPSYFWLAETVFFEGACFFLTVTPLRRNGWFTQKTPNWKGKVFEPNLYFLVCFMLIFQGVGNSMKKRIEAFACASLVLCSSSTQSSDVGFGRLVVGFSDGLQ